MTDKIQSNTLISIYKHDIVNALLHIQLHYLILIPFLNLQRIVILTFLFDFGILRAKCTQISN